MDLETIKKIVNDPNVDAEMKEKLIIGVLAMDKKVVPTLLEILSVERENNKELIADLNLEVSRYHIHINDKRYMKKNLPFLNQQTKELYNKWKNFISPLFNNKFDDTTEG